MAYTTINKSTDYFNTKLYAGNSSAGHSITGVGFQPDWTWIKERDASNHHIIVDAVRGANKYLLANDTQAEVTSSNYVSSLDSDGFTLGSDAGVNRGSMAAWNWKAGGTAPAITYTVKVVSDSGNKYRFDDFGTSAVTLDLQEGGTYTFDQADSSNSGHPLRFYTAADKTGGEYTTGVTTNGTPGSSGAYTRITVAASAPTLYYQCSNHANMGGQANTNSTFGSSNFKGAIQSLVSANITAGFSIVTYTGNSSTSQTIGHGLGVKPKVLIIKRRTGGAESWIYWQDTDNDGTANQRLLLSGNQANYNNYFVSFQNTTFTLPSTNDTAWNSTDTYVAYCFAEKLGYSKMNYYLGNGNASGSFVYTGFKPAFLINKRIDSTGNWMLIDNKRLGYNPAQRDLRPNLTNAEGNDETFDFLSNGFKVRTTSSDFGGGSNAVYVYMAFAEAPLVGTNNIPCTAR